MAAGVSLRTSGTTKTLIPAELQDVLPTRDVFMEEARKFIALKTLSSWKNLRSDSGFVPDLVHLKTMAQYLHCRSVKIGPSFSLLR